MNHIFAKLLIATCALGTAAIGLAATSEEVKAKYLEFSNAIAACSGPETSKCVGKILTNAMEYTASSSSSSSAASSTEVIFFQVQSTEWCKDDPTRNIVARVKDRGDGDRNKVACAALEQIQCGGGFAFCAFSRVENGVVAPCQQSGNIVKTCESTLGG